MLNIFMVTHLAKQTNKVEVLFICMLIVYCITISITAHDS